MISAQNKIISPQDIFYMRRALQLAKKGAGKVSPNPMVGAVIVKDGRIIGAGYHEKYGAPHAEVNAIESATESVTGATLYSNLEPCCHLNKKTPPCAQRIVKEKIKRVVIAGMDPNPHVNGKGIQFLRKSGLTVDTGVLEKENSDLNRFFIKFMQTGHPYVTVKIAQTLDGRISKNKFSQSRITNTKSERLVHKWRSQYDAVLVGANTIRVDNPQLTVRHNRGRNPLRVVISGSLNIPETSRILTKDLISDTLIYTADTKNKKKYNILRDAGANLIDIQNNHLSLYKILQDLAEKGVASLLVEGGQEIFTWFISSGLTDEISFFIAPIIYGEGPKFYSTEGYDFTNEYFLYKVQKIDSDLLCIYRKFS